MAVAFRRVWLGSDLGEARPCKYAYKAFDYDAQPPLAGVRLTVTFDWAGMAEESDSPKTETVELLGAQLAALGLVLPADFATFQSKLRTASSSGVRRHSRLSPTASGWSAPSGTGCREWIHGHWISP